MTCGADVELISVYLIILIWELTPVLIPLGSPSLTRMLYRKMSFCHPDSRHRFSLSTTTVALFGENCVISQHGAIEPGQYFVRRREAPSPILGIATGPPLNVNNMSGFLGKRKNV